MLELVTSPARAFQLEGARFGLNSTRYVTFEKEVQVSSTFEPEITGLKSNTLIRLCEQFQLPGMLLSEGLRGRGRELFKTAIQLGQEGVMAKRRDSRRSFVVGFRFHKTNIFAA